MEQQTLSNMSECEEGEISNDSSDNLYTPLERPHVPAALNSNRLESSDEDNDLNDSSSDSDSSGKNNFPKLRKLNAHKQIKTESNKKKNFNIWSADIQADILTNSLSGCNMNQFSQRGRDVESYNYRLKVFDNQDSNVTSNDISSNEEKNNSRYLTKRKHDGAYKDKKFQFKNRIAVNKCQTNVGNPRNILNLCTTIDNTDNEIAVDIANKLFEVKEDLILRAVNILGKEIAISFFEETKKIEENGGMLIMNGTRRRTPGGVFFYLIKSSDDLPQDKLNQVFIDDKKTSVRNKKQEGKERKKKENSQFKESLIEDDFPSLLSRTKLAIEKLKDKRMAEESSEVMNPPPSPAADARISGGNGDDLKIETETERNLVKYDNDFFECEDATIESD